MSKRISNRAFQKLKEFEGCRLSAYRDAAGVWTIGYGHTRNVRRGDRISGFTANEYLEQDVAEAVEQVNALGLDFSLPQLDALTSFVFNLGIERLRSSTLLRYIREGRGPDEIRKQFLRWVYGGTPKRKLEGLVRRREWEADRFFQEY